MPYPFQKQDFRFDAGAALDGFRPAFGILLARTFFVGFGASRGFAQITAQLVLVKVIVAFFRLLHHGAKRRIGQHHIKTIGLEFLFFGTDGSQVIQGIMTDDIGMPVIVDNHVHLGDAG